MIKIVGATEEVENDIGDNHHFMATSSGMVKIEQDIEYEEDNIIYRLVIPHTFSLFSFFLI